MATYSIEEIFQVALAAGFPPDRAATWTAIALAESGGRTDAVNSAGEDSRGLWQINVDPQVRAPGRRAAGRELTGAVPRPDSVLLTTAPAPTVHPTMTPAYGYDLIDAGVPPGQSVDSDGDGLTDAFEELAGTDPAATDTDRDGLADGYEAMRSRTDPLSVDTDGDDRSDPMEVLAGTDAGRLPGIGGVIGHGEFAENARDGILDSDNDGLSDRYETLTGMDPFAVDTDDDGLSDAWEVAAGSDPLLVDSDGDGLTDAFEQSADNGEPGWST